MDVQNHGGKIHGKKAPDAFTWYCPHLEISLDLVEQARRGPLLHTVSLTLAEANLLWLTTS